MSGRRSIWGIDVFAGAGGMSLGAALAGVDVQLAVEVDGAAAATYACNHPKTAVLNAAIEDVPNSKFRAFRKRRRPLVMFGGPPCQGFSYSNLRTRSSANPDNWLFSNFIQVVEWCQPDWVVFENVRGFANTEGGKFVDLVVDQIESLGYSASYGLLNALDCGVPQDRARFFLIASRGKTKPTFPVTSGRPNGNDVVTVRDAISDLPVLTNGASVSWRRYRTPPRSAYAKVLRRSDDGCMNHVVTRNANYVVERYRHIRPGGNWEDIPAKLMDNYRDRQRCHTGIYHRLHPKRPSVVIGNFRKNMLIHPTQQRGLSVREAARIQSFPDDYEFFGTIGFQQQQVGNAVPPLLAEAVFMEIMRQGGYPT
jgi:DNA (cytosine-5)-methyltransferase 1